MSLGRARSRSGAILMAAMAVMAVAAGCGGGENELLARQNPAAPTSVARPETGYADVNGLRMYYEIHGVGRPVILLHGAYMSADAMAPVTDVLARTRRVIVPEAQGHARTADIDRPITYEAMADDVAALMEALEISEADIVGYSMGAGVAIQLAIRHPAKVRRMVAASATYRYDGAYPEVLAMFPAITPEMFEGTPFEAEYRRLSPKPDNFPALVQKLKVLDTTPHNWPERDIAGIRAPTLIVVGDQDIVRLEHAVDMLRLMGGGRPGDMPGFVAPEDQLAILPGVTHIGVVAAKGKLFAELAAEFIDPPAAPPNPMAPR